MVKQLFTVYDKKAKFHLAPICYNQEGEAQRAFVDLVNDKRTLIGLHPEDFALYKIGDYDDYDGKIECLKIPVLIANGFDVVKKIEVI